MGTATAAFGRYGPWQDAARDLRRMAGDARPAGRAARRGGRKKPTRPYGTGLVGRAEWPSHAAHNRGHASMGGTRRQSNGVGNAGAALYDESPAGRAGISPPDAQSLPPRWPHRMAPRQGPVT